MILFPRWSWTVAACLAGGVSIAPARAEPVAAAWTDDFVHSIGVNVHWHDETGLYHRGYEILKTKLAESGIRHLRDGAVPNAFKRGTDLYNELGIRSTLIHSVRTGQHSATHPEYKSPLVPARIAEALVALKNAIPSGALAAIEGPNEYDLFHDDRDKDWAGSLRKYQSELYRIVKADPDLKDVPVVGPSLTSPEACQKVGDLSAAMDFGCGHFYRSVRFPGSIGWGGRFDFPPYGGGLYGGMDYNIASARVVCDRKPVWSTETGYATHNEGISEAVQSKYVPRLFAEFFRLGIVRTHHYELLDERNDRKDDQANFGLLRHDYSEKPAFTALKGLIRLLSDNQWDADRKRWTASAFKPDTLDFRLDGATKNIRTVLLQKRDGDFYLLLWQEVADPKFHTETWQPKFERPGKVSLVVASSIRTAVNHAPDALGRMSEKQLVVDGGKALSVDVPDQIVVVRLVPEPERKP